MLIVDVRPNGGGHDQLAMQFAGRFTSASVLTEIFRTRNGRGHDDLGNEIRRMLSVMLVVTIAGLLLAPFTFVHVNMGFIGLKAFPAAVVGGFGSVPGAIVGGLVIGVVEALAGFYLAEGFKDVAAYVVVLLVLMVRPSGIFGETAKKKV